MLVPLSAQIVADDPIEERQIAKEKYSSYKRPGVEPITIVKTYVKVTYDIGKSVHLVV